MRGIGIRFTQLLYTLHLRNLLLFESIQTLFGIYFRRIKFRIHLDPEYMPSIQNISESIGNLLGIYWESIKIRESIGNLLGIYWESIRNLLVIY